MKFAILGTGNSIKDFIPSPEITTVGVNDIEKFIRTDYIVCVDPPRVFNKERLKIITESKPKTFFTLKGNDGEDYDEWQKYFKNIKQFKQAEPRGNPDMLSSETYLPVSICSPFSACCVAYKLGAKEITLYGVDLINHPNFSEELIQRIIKDFVKLKVELEKRGVKLFVGSKETRLFPAIQFSHNQVR